MGVFRLTEYMENTGKSMMNKPLLCNIIRNPLISAIILTFLLMCIFVKTGNMDIYKTFSISVLASSIYLFVFHSVIKDHYTQSVSEKEEISEFKDVVGESEL